MLAACVAAVVVVAHAAALLHYAIVAHGICVEHGHLVHGEGGVEAAEREAPAPIESARPLADPDHEHCLIPARTPGEFVLGTQPLEGVDELAPKAPLVAAASAPLTAAAILSLAPKQSPPV